MNQKMFSSDVELGKFLVSTGVIPDAHCAITETSLTCQLHTTPSGISILAFHGFLDYTTRFLNGEFDLVSSENYEVLHFISTKVNSKFSINKAAVELFEQHFAELSNLSNQLMDTQLVITGQGMGAYLAILFTLLHQHTVDVEEYNGSKTAKRPICITFGSPLLGDEALRRALSERPQWNSCFLNVVSKKDTLACFFSTNTPYMPFGTFLFCTESGGHTSFEDQETILTVLDDMASTNVGNSQKHNYANELGMVRRRILYRGASEFGEFNLNPLRAGIVLQFQEMGMLKDNSHGLIAKTEEKQVKMIKTKRKVSAYDPTKKLNEMKISLTYMEWYMKRQRSKGGYYDGYKNPKSQKEIESQHVVIRHQRTLNQYWKKLVEEKKVMPQKEGAKLRKRWLYSGNNCRRIVEPLDIAEHYKSGKTNYMAVRSEHYEHYEILEKWLEDDINDQKPSNKKTKAASLTEDSCFWAHVEEALISLRELKNGGLSNIATHIKQKQFEEYVWGEIDKFSLSPDVFLEGSSLMKWWSEYKAYEGSLYDSKFAQYMNNGGYTSYH